MTPEGGITESPGRSTGGGSKKGRRGFLEALLGGSLFSMAAMIVYPIWRYIFPPRDVAISEEAVVVGTTDEFPPNSGKIFLFNNEPAILVRTPQGDYRAFTATCTHLACTVQYRPDIAHIWCACHNGHYDLTGKNIAGPPPRPLTPFEVQIREDEVLVRRQV